MRNFTRTLLVFAVDIGIDKTDRERLDIVSYADLQRFAQRGLIKSCDNTAISGDTLICTDSELKWCQQRLFNKSDPATEATWAKRASHL